MLIAHKTKKDFKVDVKLIGFTKNHSIRSFEVNHPRLGHMFEIHGFNFKRSLVHHAGGIQDRIDYMLRDITNTKSYSKSKRGHFGDLIGGVYERKNLVIRFIEDRLRQKIELVSQAKKPVNKKRHVGIEIEFLTRSASEDLALDFLKVGLGDFVELKTDGSIETGESDECDGSCREECECAYCGEEHFCDDETECNGRTRIFDGGASHWETCSTGEPMEHECDHACIEVEIENDDGSFTTMYVCGGYCNGHYCNGSEDHPNYDCDCECTCSNGINGLELACVFSEQNLYSNLKKVCDVLAKHDAEVNRSCGLHVHLDMRTRRAERVYNNLRVMQPMLYAMCPTSRVKSGYCRPSDLHDFETAKIQERYKGINARAYSEHKTIEVRIHSGTVNYDKIANWCAVLLSIAGIRTTLHEMPKTLKLAAKTLGLNTELASYVKTRIANFKAKHLTNTTHVLVRRWLNAADVRANQSQNQIEMSEVA